MARRGPPGLRPRLPPRRAGEEHASTRLVPPSLLARPRTGERETRPHHARIRRRLVSFGPRQAKEMNPSCEDPSPVGLVRAEASEGDEPVLRGSLAGRPRLVRSSPSRAATAIRPARHRQRLHAGARSTSSAPESLFRRPLSAGVVLANAPRPRSRRAAPAPCCGSLRPRGRAGWPRRFRRQRSRRRCRPCRAPAARVTYAGITSVWRAEVETATWKWRICTEEKRQAGLATVRTKAVSAAAKESTSGEPEARQRQAS